MNEPERVFGSLARSSIGFFARKNENDDKGNGAVVADAVVDVVVIGNVDVASGRTPMADDVSSGTTGGGLLMNDRNKCRHNSSGISALSTSRSKNCRKPV